MLGPGGGGLATGLVGGLGGLGLGPMIGQPPSAGTLGGLGSTSGSGDSSPPGGIISGSTMNRYLPLIWPLLRYNLVGEKDKKSHFMRIY